MSAGYRVGDDGSVWSCWEWKSNGQFKGTRKEIGATWKMMRHSHDAAGYPRVTIIGMGRVRVHSVVLLAFVGPRPDGMQCCHNDGNPKNASLSNLRWDTAHANHADRNKHGTSNAGERNGMRKLTAELVRKIRHQHALLKGSRPRLAMGQLIQMSREFSVPGQTISEIVRKDAWKHIT